jgi:hypothetical protein
MLGVPNAQVKELIHIALGKLFYGILKSRCFRGAGVVTLVVCAGEENFRSRAVQFEVVNTIKIARRFRRSATPKRP